MIKVILGFELLLNAGEQIPVDDLIWVLLEGDPREEISEADARVGETLKGGSPRAIKDDARICIILDCCRFILLMFCLLLIPFLLKELFAGWKSQSTPACREE